MDDADLIPRITPACLRTTWITIGRSLDVPLDELMVGAGHTQLSQTLYYNRALDHLLGRAAETIAAAVTEEITRLPHAA